MSPIEITVRYRRIEYVSDRTARETLKRLSKIIRRAQLLEANYILARQELSLAELQSARDRTNSYIASAPLLEIQCAQKGSWKIVAWLGCFGLWFLSNTVGESLKDGWAKTKLNKDIVNYISKTRPEKFIEFLKHSLDTEKFEGRWEVSDLKVKKSKKKTEYIVTLSPVASFKGDIPQLVDDKYVLKEVSKKIKEADGG